MQTEPRNIARIAMPLAGLTAVGMLATDLYLPAVPLLPAELGGTVAQSQLTLASFMAALALSQPLWGWASDRFGEDGVLKAGMILLLGSSAACAVSSGMGALILGRAVQGLGSGAATAVVPALLRKSFAEAEAVRAIALVGMAESVVPALGPVLGAALITVTSWRTTFWIIAGLTAAFLPFVSRVTANLAASAAARPAAPPSGLSSLLRERSFTLYALGYSLMFSALIMFVSSAPQLITGTLGLPVQLFSVMQVLGVACFMLGASRSGGLVAAMGVPRVQAWGSALQGAAGALLLACGFMRAPSFALICVAWSFFCAGLGLRGPSAMARALSSVGSRAGQASGLMMLLSFGFSSAATAAVAPFLDRGLLPTAAALCALTAASALLTR